MLGGLLIARESRKKKKKNFVCGLSSRARSHKRTSAAVDVLVVIALLCIRIFMNCKEHHLPELELATGQVREALQCILHTILL
jgi:hypothetical protein